MLHLRQSVRDYIHTEDEGGRPFLQGKETVESPVTGLKSVTGSWIIGDPPTEPSCMGMVPPVVIRATFFRGLTDVLVLLPKYDGVSVMPSQGLQGGGTTSVSNLRIHCVHHHVQDNIVIMEELNSPQL